MACQSLPRMKHKRESDFSNLHCGPFDTDVQVIVSHEKVVLLWFSVARFGVGVSVTFHLTCVHIIFSSVSRKL